MTEAKASFERIKKVIGEAPVLASPDYMKEFLIFSFHPNIQLQSYSYRRTMKGSNNR
jgi:hypothetical protein